MEEYGEIDLEAEREKLLGNENYELYKSIERHLKKSLFSDIYDKKRENMNKFFESIHQNQKLNNLTKMDILLIQNFINQQAVTDLNTIKKEKSDVLPEFDETPTPKMETPGSIESIDLKK